jgi:inosine-uridine nucleoside N-ribohydrolase
MAVGRIPVILDTDIGGDIDDTWALAMLLKSPEFDVRLVVGDAGMADYRGRLIAKLLETAERTDVPVGIGCSEPSNRRRLQEAWLGEYRLSSYPGAVCDDGVGAMIGTIMDAHEPVTLIAIGPMPNVKEALTREPRIAQRARFVGMHGSLRSHYDGTPGAIAECNVIHNIAAARAGLGAPWISTTITPLDTCGMVRLEGERYRRLLNCREPALRAVLENYRIWAGEGKADAVTRGTSILFDTVAVYLAFDTAYCDMRSMRVQVTDDGFTRESADGTEMQVAYAWKDLDSYLDFLTERMTGEVIR